MCQSSPFNICQSHKKHVFCMPFYYHNYNHTNWKPDQTKPAKKCNLLFLTSSTSNLLFLTSSTHLWPWDKGQGHQCWYSRALQLLLWYHASFKRSSLNSVWGEKSKRKIFLLSMEMTKLSALNNWSEKQHHQVYVLHNQVYLTTV